MSKIKKCFVLFSQKGTFSPKIYKVFKSIQKVIQKNPQLRFKQYDNQIIASAALSIYKLQRKKHLLLMKHHSVLGISENIPKSTQDGIQMVNSSIDDEKGDLLLNKKNQQQDLNKQNTDQQTGNSQQMSKTKNQSIQTSVNNQITTIEDIQKQKQQLIKLVPALSKYLQFHKCAPFKKPADKKYTYTGFFDGCTKNNPGASGIGYYITNGKQMLFDNKYYIGIKTNNQSQFYALLYLLVDAYINGVRRINIYGDSKIAILIALGKFKARHQNIIDLALTVNQVLKYFEHKKLEHIERKYNTYADKLSNQSLKRKYVKSKAQTKQTQTIQTQTKQTQTKQTAQQEEHKKSDLVV